MSESSIETRLNQLGIVLPEATQPAGQYANIVEVNGLVFVAGKAPTGRSTGGVKPKGKLGRDYTTQQGYQFARKAGIEILAVLKAELGSLDSIKRVVKLQGFVNAVPEFEEHHKVLDGCSELMIAVFGDRGIHARSVFGAVSVRDNLPIVIDSIFQI